MTFATKGMARRLGTATQPSWALSFIHIEYIDRRLRAAYRSATTPAAKHEYACAGFANLLGYLGWLRGTELCMAMIDNLEVVDPSQGAAHGLPCLTLASFFWICFQRPSRILVKWPIWSLQYHAVGFGARRMDPCVVEFDGAHHWSALQYLHGN
jgi:hypothetical protein